MKFRTSGSIGTGLAALRWQLINPHPTLAPDRLRIALAGLYYARILYINPAETRDELFRRVGEAAEGLISGDPVAKFSDWQFSVLGIPTHIWPWHIVNPEDLGETGIYLVSLREREWREFWVHFTTVVRHARVLIPSSVLLILYTLSQELGEADRVLLGEVLRAINGYFQTPDAIRLGSVGKAFATARPLLDIHARPSGPKPPAAKS